MRKVLFLLLAVILIMAVSCDFEPIEYEWKSNDASDTNSFIDDTTTDFSPLVEGINRQWIMVDASGNPFQEPDIDAYYLLEVKKEKASFYFDFEIGSYTSTRVNINNFWYEGENRDDMAYFLVRKYPDGYRHAWAVNCYWYDSNKWHFTQTIQTDADMIPIWYKNVTEDVMPTFFEEAKAIGSISRIYQTYKGSDVYLEDPSIESYVVEFSSAHDNLLGAIKNKKGKESTGRSSWAGALQDDTVAYAYFKLDTLSDELSACIHVVGEYTSYIYLNLEIVGGKLVIGSKLLDHYDSEAGKYVDIHNYDGSLYYCEYEGDYDLSATLAKLGTVDKSCNYTGGTGQTKPYIQSFSDSSGSYVSIAAQFTSFNQDVLEENSTGTRPQNPYFTHGYQVYDLDYDNSGLFFAELDVFFTGDGEVSEVQVRKITDLDALESGAERVLDGTYATTYVINASFLEEV